MKLDKWQQQVMDYDGDITIRAGRQVGKSTVVAKKAAKFALDHAERNILIIAASQRQSSLLFEKIKAEIDEANALVLQKHRFRVKPELSERRNLERRRFFEQKFGIYQELPTKTSVRLKNGSVIYSLPVGKTGYFVRGFSLDLLIADEAAYIPENVWLAVRPMIAVSRKIRKEGFIILLSTPFGKGGFFYDSCFDDDFKHFVVSSENCQRIPKKFLSKEKSRLTRIEYAQEYLGEFIDEFNQFFPTQLIKKAMTFYEWSFKKEFNPSRKYFLGVDFARYGEDENAFVIAEMGDDNRLRIVRAETTERRKLSDTFGRIVDMDSKYSFNRIFVDDAGIGAGITDMLIEKLGRRVVGLNNSRRTIDKEGRKGRIFKEDLYSNASLMMEKGEIDIINSLKLMRSLRSMTYKYTLDGNLRIYGVYSHLSEAFVRVCWATKAKGLKLFVY